MAEQKNDMEHMPLAPIASHGSAEDLSEDQYFMEPDEVSANLRKFVSLFLEI